jgi:hypothetical protein
MDPERAVRGKTIRLTWTEGPTSGYTLTVALDLLRGRAVGIASGAKEWFPVRGTFEVFG